jgi:DNA polymerase-3 subunit delta'
MSDTAMISVAGQDRATARLEAALANPVHAYLFVGPRGSGKRALARAFAGELLAAGSPDPERARRLSAEERHPDLVFVEPEGRTFRKQEAEALVRLAMRTPVEGDRKVLVATELGAPEPIAMAKLLKIVEEPPGSTIFLLLADRVPPELATIASRCTAIDLDPLSDAVVAAALVEFGVPGDVASAVAGSAGGDLDRARLMASDERFALRRDLWRSVPERLDGTGAAVADLVGELRTAIDDAQTPLDARHEEEVAELEKRVELYGERGSGRRELTESHKREVRRHRADELRSGLATLSGRYRDELVSPGRDRRTLVEAIRVIDAAAENLIRNPVEPLLLQALFLRLPPLM